jgi:hypothetical protein
MKKDKIHLDETTMKLRSGRFLQAITSACALLAVCSLIVMGASSPASRAPSASLEARWVWGTDTGTALKDAGDGGHDARIFSTEHTSVETDPVSGLAIIVFDGIVDLADTAPHGHVVSETLPAPESGFTVSALIFPEGGQAAYAPVVSRISDPATWNDGFAIYMGPEGTVCAYAGDFSSPGSRLDTGIIPESRAWTHVALSYDGAQAILFIDGAEAVRTAVPAAGPAVGPLAIGPLVAIGVTRPWNGALAEVRFQAAPLSASAIAAMASGALAAYTPPAVELEPAMEPVAMQEPFAELPDSDGDGVPDEEEIRLGRDPFSPGAVSPHARILKVHTPME